MDCPKCGGDCYSFTELHLCSREVFCAQCDHKEEIKWGSNVQKNEGDNNSALLESEIDF